VATTWAPSIAISGESDVTERDGTESLRRVTALGGGHGLYVSLSALRRLPVDLTAVVTVADDGGSSGRLRSEFGVLPPGDLRMALAALCGDDDWGETWASVLQHRFAGTGEMRGHVTGNLLIVSLWELLGDHVAALDWVGRLLGARGRVLPMALTPLDISAQVRGLDPHEPDALSSVRGQVAVAKSAGAIESISLLPDAPQACPEAADAIRAAQMVVLGPGSWFTSVLVHLLGHDGETEGFRAVDHLRVLLDHAPDLTVGTVMVDRSDVPDLAELEALAGKCGARLRVADVASDDGSPRHDPEKLATAYAGILAEL